jgi:hypothetical protein
MFRGNLSPPISGPIKPRKKPTESVNKLMFLLVSYWVYSSALNLEAISSPLKSRAVSERHGVTKLKMMLLLCRCLHVYLEYLHKHTYL